MVVLVRMTLGGGWGSAPYTSAVGPRFVLRGSVVVFTLFFHVVFGFVEWCFVVDAVASALAVEDDGVGNGGG